MLWLSFLFLACCDMSLLKRGLNDDFNAKKIEMHSGDISKSINQFIRSSTFRQRGCSHILGNFCSIRSVQQPGEPGNVREFESEPGK